MLTTILKFLIGGIGVYFIGKILWRFVLKYQVNKLNKAAVIMLDNKIKKLAKKLGTADAKTAKELAEIKQKKKDVEDLVRLYEEKLENDNN